MKVMKGTSVVFLASEIAIVLMGALAYSEGRSYPGNGAVMGALIMTLPFLLEKAGLFRMPLSMQIWASLAVGLHTFGLLVGLYDSTWWWDDLTHLVSSAMVGTIAALALYLFDLHSVKIKVPRWAYPMMIVVFSIFIGTIWEIAEFAGDVLASTRMQYSLSDTLGDCYMDMLGGLMASMMWALWFWKDRDGSWPIRHRSP